MTRRMAAQLRYRLGIRCQIRIFFERHTNDSRPRMRRKIDPNLLTVLVRSDAKYVAFLKLESERSPPCTI
jgi:hypothetical protein